ncbi:hypothetical protein HDV06_000931 [Boothiomyces sp. JEL0866]|nr:hypothetical protein HDV06_000931 [Boothiomyces sp. JEL0866]
MTTLEKLLDMVDWRIVLAALPLVYLMPWTFFTAALVIGAFLLGILFEEANVQDGGGIALINQHYKSRIQPINDDANSKLKESLENRVVYQRPDGVSPELEAVLNKFISNIVRDFINGWYNNLNVSKKTDFPDAVHSAIFDSFVTLGNSARKINPTNLILSTMESVIQHVKEYREFDLSGLDMQDYLKVKPESRFNRFNSRKAIVDHLCEQSMKLIIHILPRADRNSPALFAIVQEIVGTTVLLPIIDKITNPAFINESLLNALKKKNETANLKIHEKSQLQQILENEGTAFDFQSYLSDEYLYVLNLYQDMQEAKATDTLEGFVSNIKRDEYGRQLPELFNSLKISKVTIETLTQLEKRLSDILDIQVNLFISEKSIKLDVQVTSEKSEYYVGSVDRAAFLNQMISQLHQKLLQIADSMGSADPDTLSNLLEDKLLYQAQLEEFRELLVQEQETPLQKKLLDIHGAQISVALQDITKLKKESSIMSLGFMNSTTQNFEITIATEFKTWSLVKTESDFEQLSKSLNNHFPRIYPLKSEVKGFISKTTDAEYQAKAQEFLQYLNTVNSDSVVKHSVDFITFLQPEGEVKKQEMKKSSSWIEPNISVKKVLSSASIGIGSALKRVTEATSVTESPTMDVIPEPVEQISDTVDLHLGADGDNQATLPMEDEFDDDEIVFNSSVSKEDLNIILDVTFTTIEELFSLNQSNQWMRQQSLHLIKVVLKRMFGKKLSSVITSKLDQASTESSICTTIDSLTENLWPDCRPWGSGPQIPPKTTYETERIKHQLFCLINKQEGMQRSEEFEKAVVSIQNLLGNANTAKGLLRGFFLVQNQHLSAGLCCEIIESIVNMITARKNFHPDKMKFAVILSSVRSGRMADRVGILVTEEIRRRGHTPVLIDPKPSYNKLSEISEIFRACDGFVVCSAEYNFNIPPALTNLMNYFLDEYKFKPSAICCYSPGSFGGIRAGSVLRSYLDGLGCPSIPKMFPIPGVNSSVKEDGSTDSEVLRKSLTNFLLELEWYAEALSVQRAKGLPQYQ